jgi:ABC-type Na+ efflux pump permease subunit
VKSVGRLSFALGLLLLSLLAGAAVHACAATFPRLWDSAQTLVSRPSLDALASFLVSFALFALPSLLLLLLLVIIVDAAVYAAVEQGLRSVLAPRRRIGVG